MKKIIKILGNIVLNTVLIISILVLILLAGSYVQIQFLNKDYPNIFQYTAFQVASGSMLDTIKVDDIVIVKIDNDIKNINTGDIIVFKQDNAIITHRVIEINDEEIITKGDANNTNDEPITKDSVIGRVIKIIPNIAIWKKVLTSPEILLLIFGTMALWVASFYIFKKKENDSKQ